MLRYVMASTVFVKIRYGKYDVVKIRYDEYDVLLR